MIFRPQNKRERFIKIRCFNNVLLVFEICSIFLIKRCTYIRTKKVLFFCTYIRTFLYIIIYSIIRKKRLVS